LQGWSADGAAKRVPGVVERLAKSVCRSCVAVLLCSLAAAQTAVAASRGTLIVDGGGTTKPVVERFAALAGGPSARIVVIPTGASELKFGAADTILNPDWPRERPEWAAYEAHLKQMFGTQHVAVLHTRDRNVADSDEFVAPLRNATGAFLTPGNAGRIAASYLDTRMQKELEALLARGGVIFGSSAGAIIQGSFIVRGIPGKPVLMARDHERGFGWLPQVAINPHLTEAKREAELVQVIDAHPELLGIGLDEGVALIVRGQVAEVIGNGTVAIYDNQQHGNRWYYTLQPGDRFDLATRRKIEN